MDSLCITELGVYSLEEFLEFKDKQDEEIVAEAKNGNTRAQECLISKYENL